jgi:diguanylate cyclase (GGDEF)-like protein/PAS domain S-box-containing protein
MTSVVIVDDQAINLKLLARFARTLEHGIDVKAFLNAAEALVFLADHPADLVVTDYVMPKMNGAEFIRRCRALPTGREMPIIVVTAFEDREFRYRALETGASDFLLSPVDGHEFCTRARNLLALWAHQRRLQHRALSAEDELATALRQHAEEIRAREERLRRVVDTVPALIRSTDREGRIVILNHHHERLFGLDWDTAIRARKQEVFSAEYALRHLDLDRRILEHGETVDGVEETVRDSNGDERILLTTKAPLRNGEGAVDQIVTVSLDITQRKRVEQAARESEARFRSLIEGAVLGVMLERDDKAIFANRTCAQIFGYDSPDALLSLPSVEALFTNAESRRRRRLKTKGSPSPPSAKAREIEGVTRDGRRIWVEVLTQPVQWQGAPALLSTIADVTLRKAYEDRLQRQANFDDLTGLPNRVLALDRLRRAVVSAARHRHKGAVLFIDLDHFKKINDTWGHTIGDMLLRLAAERLNACVRAEDTVARLGGDEFTVILPHIGAAAATEPVIQKILAAFSRPFDLGDHEAFVTASIGVTVFPSDGEDPAMLMQNADVAMYLAKEQGRHTFRHFTPELSARSAQRMKIEEQLVHAIEREELSLHYQPIVETATGRLAGAEALLRWDNPELGPLAPEEFVPLAEESGLIAPIGRWVMRSACEQLAVWHEMGHGALGLSFNISSRQLHGPGLVDALARALRRHRLPASCLELEITEGCLLQEVKEIAATLQALNRLGVRLALDDFGTGYSCLSHLKELPVDTVKIDKSFVLNVATDSGSATMVEAIIAMAHRLGIRVVGEGVETAEQLRFIRQRGCDMAQGFFFSPPLPAAGFIDWARAWSDANQPAPPARQALA